MRTKQEEYVKKTLRVLKLNSIKNIKQFGFCISVVLFFVLCFFSIAYLTPSKSYSVIELLLYFSNDQIETAGLSSVDIVLAGIGEYCMLFAPIISALPTILIGCRERRSKAIRYSLYRMGTHMYNASYTVSAMIVGGLILFIGYLFYTMICIKHFPMPSLEFVRLFFGTDSLMFGCILPLIVGVFLYGSISVLPAVFLSMFTDNPYMVLCSSFAIMYGINSLINEISLRITNITIYNIIYYLTPSRICTLLVRIEEDILYKVLTILFWIGLTILIIVIRNVYLSHRTDKAT